MSENLVELARRYVALNDELETVRDQIKRAVLNGAGGASENPTSATRPGEKRPQSSPAKALRGQQVAETILELVRSSPGLRTAAIMKTMAAHRSTTGERLKRLQAKGLIERDGEGAGWRTPA